MVKLQVGYANVQNVVHDHVVEIDVLGMARLEVVGQSDARSHEHDAVIRFGLRPNRQFRVVEKGVYLRLRVVQQLRIERVQTLKKETLSLSWLTFLLQFEDILLLSRFDQAEHLQLKLQRTLPGL